MNILSSPTTAILRWNMESHTKNYQNTMEQLSSGSRIVKCKDDVNTYKTSVVIDSKLSQNAVLKDNIKYGNDVLNIVSQAEDNVLNQIGTIRDLCMEISNGTYSAEDRGNILSDIRSRLEYIDYVAANTSFNDKKLLDGTCSEYRIQIAADQYVDIANAMTDVHVSALGIDLDPSITPETWTEDDIASYMTKLDEVMDTILKYETNAGAFSIGLDNSFDLKEASDESLYATKSELVDTDYAKTSADLVKHQLLQQFAINMQTDYNQLAGSMFQLLYPAK